MLPALAARLALPPSARSPRPGRYWIDRGPVTHLGGIPSDLCGWFALLGLARVLRRTGAVIGWDPESGESLPWRPVVGMPLDDVARHVRAAIEHWPADGPPPELKWYAGRQSVETTLRAARELALRGDVGADLAEMTGARSDCPTFYWSPDAHYDPGTRAFGSSFGRPTIEWLAYQGAVATRPGLVRFDRDAKLVVVVSLTPPAPAPLWLRVAARQDSHALAPWVAERRASPRWRFVVSRIDRYRRGAGPPAPVLGPPPARWQAESSEARWSEGEAAVKLAEQALKRERRALLSAQESE